MDQIVKCLFRAERRVLHTVGQICRPHTDNRLRQASRNPHESLKILVWISHLTIMIKR